MIKLTATTRRRDNFLINLDMVGLMQRSRFR